MDLITTHFDIIQVLATFHFISFTLIADDFKSRPSFKADMSIHVSCFFLNSQFFFFFSRESRNLTRTKPVTFENRETMVFSRAGDVNINELPLLVA